MSNKVVFYSTSPYGTGDIKTGSPNISISGGVATLDVAQTDNIGAGCDIEYNSLYAYIAPNRIPFTSGGTTPIKPGDKIQGATSTATGIVRAVAVTTGSWANGDAAGYIYFEQTSGTWNSSEQIDRIRPTSSTDVATTNGSLQGNIGNGNTEFVVLTATGSDASDQTSVAVTSIHHEYASMSDLEAGCTDANHINSTDLTSAGANIQIFATCYYDHSDYTLDTTRFTIDVGTTDSDHWVKVYTPIGGSESINSQRHAGTWDDHKWALYTASAGGGNILAIKSLYTKIEGLQVSRSATDDYDYLIAETTTDGTDGEVTQCILKGNAERGIYFTKGGLIANNIIYDLYKYGVDIYQANATNNHTVFNNTVIDCSTNDFYLASDGGTLTVKNNIAQGTATNYSGYGWTTSNNISEDASSPDSGYQNMSVTFADETNNDFHLASSDTSAKDNGVDLSSDADYPLWRDIDGDDRTGGTWDIGADEYVSAGGFKAFWAKNSTATIGEVG